MFINREVLKQLSIHPYYETLSRQTNKGWSYPSWNEKISTTTGWGGRQKSPLSSPSPPALKLSQRQGLFQEVSSSHQVTKVLEFHLNEYSGLISFRMDWLDLLAVQWTLKRLLQDHNLKVSILWYSAFFMVHLSHPYMTAGKTIAMTIWTFAGKMMSLLFNMLSRFVVVFFPRNKVKVKVKSLSRVRLFVTRGL